MTAPSSLVQSEKDLAARLSAMRVVFARNASATGSSNNSPHVSPNSFIQRSHLHMRLHAVELVEPDVQ